MGLIFCVDPEVEASYLDEKKIYILAYLSGEEKEIGIYYLSYPYCNIFVSKLL